MVIHQEGHHHYRLYPSTFMSGRSLFVQSLASSRSLAKTGGEDREDRSVSQ